PPDDAGGRLDREAGEPRHFDLGEAAMPADQGQDQPLIVEPDAALIGAAAVLGGMDRQRGDRHRAGRPCGLASSLSSAPAHPGFLPSPRPSRAAKQGWRRRTAFVNKFIHWIYLLTGRAGSNSMPTGKAARNAAPRIVAIKPWEEAMSKQFGR